MTVRIDKVVVALPPVLEPDAVYAVRVGTGFDLYVSDATGAVAFKLNHPPALVHGSGRFDIRPNRWYIESHPRYGANNIKHATSAGSGAVPTTDPKRRGLLVSSGRTIRSLTIDGYTNNTNVSDVRVYVVARVSNTVILDDFMGYTSDSKVPMSKTFPINYTSQGEQVSIYVRSVATSSTRRFWHTTWLWEID